MRSLLTNHGRALLLLAADPDIRLRDLADALGVTERTAFGLVADLIDDGYVSKERDGRRNRYRVRTDLQLEDPAARDMTVGEVLAALVERRSGPRGTASDRVPG